MLFVIFIMSIEVYVNLLDSFFCLNLQLIINTLIAITRLLFYFIFVTKKRLLFYLLIFGEAIDFISNFPYLF